MANEDLTLRMGLEGQPQVVKGIDEVTAAEAKLTRETKLYQDTQGKWRAENGRFATSQEKVAAGVEHVGARTKQTGAQVRSLGAALTEVRQRSMQSFGSGLGMIQSQLKYGAIGLGALAIAGTKWGLSFNAQVDNARIRFGLFTDDVDGLMGQVRAIDKESATFGFAQLADAAAMLGNSGVKDIPDVLRGAANAAAAGGRGADGLQSIVLALSQIQAKGKLSQEEINQLNEAQAPGTQKAIQDAFGLTADQLGNIGAEGLDATKAVGALTAAWTSGKMADAAKKQGQSLSGQWSRTTSNLQAAAGAATKGLADGLTHDVLPASNRAIEQITALFGDKGLTDRQKLQRAKQVIRDELGPIAKDFARSFRDSGLDKELEQGFEDAMNKVASVAISAAPKIVHEFVDAWLGAGPWGKLISGLWLSRKLGLDKGALTLLKALRGDGGGGAGKLSGALGKATPVPVFVTNWGGGGMPDAPDARAPGEKAPRGGRGGKILTAIKATPLLAAEAAPPVAAATGIALLLHDLFPGFGGDNINTRSPEAQRRTQRGTVPAPGFGTGVPGAFGVVNVQIGDETVARATIRGDDHMVNRTR